VRILIINRWDDEFARYERYIDHERHQVAYVTTERHAPGIPRGTAWVEVIPNHDDRDRLLAAALRCHDAVGGFDKVLALSEFDLLTSGAVREKLGVPGLDTDALLGVRDKVTMKERVRRAGLRVPLFSPVATVADVTAFAAEHGRVMLKPRTGAASHGCFVLTAGDPVPAGLELDEYEVEEFVTGRIWHVDGLLDAGRPLFITPSRYLNTCYEFSRGAPLGSVVQTGERANQAVDHTLRCLAALHVDDGAFHLELIESATGFVFLEVGARVGGGEIPFVTRDVYGVDLIGDWIRLELGERAALTTSAAGPIKEHAGFLMIPEPVGSRLRARNTLAGTIPALYEEVLPPIGAIFDGNGGYDKILGRFRYRGRSAGEVENAIRETLARYTYLLDEHTPTS
jgi:biotin carboxylase